jgi:hypothetical protein
MQPGKSVELTAAPYLKDIRSMSFPENPTALVNYIIRQVPP